MSVASQVYPPDTLVLREVGLRDGLQLVASWPETEQKRAWLTREHHAGVRHFEIGSFLPPQRFPQFADVRAVADHCATLSGAHSIALALNARGIQDALAAQIGEIQLVVSATEAHSRANQNRSRQDALALVAQAVALRGSDGPLISVGISMAFGCSLSGAVDPDQVLAIVETAAQSGADVIGLADTVGYAGPNAVGDLTRAAQDLAGEVPICVHLHDTRGLGLANASAAMDAGCRILDGSLAGLGGCPFAPGATGNVVMEDLAFLAETKGFDTGIDLDDLLSVREILATSMPEEVLYGALARAGPSLTQARGA